MDSERTLAADVSLIGLSGKLLGRKFQILLDSGASCNFVPFDLLDTLKIEHDLVIS